MQVRQAAQNMQLAEHQRNNKLWVVSITMKMQLANAAAELPCLLAQSASQLSQRTWQLQSRSH
jgi:hypothetical protein